MDKLFEEFRERWKKLCEEIKKQKLDNSQIKILKINFLNENIHLLNEKNIDKDIKIFELEKLNTEIDLALQIAFSNYRNEKLKHQSFWSFGFNGAKFEKLPQSKK